jgi:hypothetical protein
MSFRAITALLTCLAYGAVAAAQIIPADRRIDWDQVGVPGGIPERTTICATIDAATYGTGTTDASAAINDALTNCPEEQVVFLPAGTYRLENPIDFGTASHITLRGAGVGQTVLFGAIPSGGGMIVSTQVALSAERRILSGYTKGSTRITVDDPTGVEVGTFLRLYQANDPALIWTRSGEPDVIKQRVIVIAVAGAQLDFAPPLAYGFSDVLNPRWKYSMGDSMSFSGIEDLTLEAGPDNQTANNTWLDTTYGCWIRRVDSFNCMNVHFFWTNGLRNEIRDSYMHETSTDNEGYGIQLYAGEWSDNTGFLIENNIFSDGFVFVLLDGAIGSVVGYNYVWNAHTNVWPHQTAAFDSNHRAHGMMDLWEGNIGQQFQSDGYHGSSSHHTLFRNWFNGLHPTYTTNRKMVDLCRFTYFYNVVGNVLGFAGWDTSTGAYEMTGQPDYAVPVIYRFGYPNMGNNGYSDVNPPSNPDDGGLDPLVATTTLRHGNFDYQTATTIWDDAIADRALPSSLYLSAKPAWFGDVVWPPIGPDVTGGQAESDHAHKIPDQLCYENGPLAGLPFDPLHCYEGAPAADADADADADSSAEADAAADADADADAAADADAGGGGDGSGCSCTLVSSGSRATWAGGILPALALVLRRRRRVP